MDQRRPARLTEGHCSTESYAQDKQLLSHEDLHKNTNLPGAAYPKVPAKEVQLDE